MTIDEILLRNRANFENVCAEVTPFVEGISVPDSVFLQDATNPDMDMQAVRRLRRACVQMRKSVISS
jgi:hypothetical protein